MSSVIKCWVTDLCSWKQQTVLLAALRGCDGRPKNDPSNSFKKRLRSAVLNNADMKTGFMSANAAFNLRDENRAEINNFFTGCLDSYPMHFFLHFLHAAEIVAYKHPDKFIAEYWMYFYSKAVEAMHLNPETEKQLDKRLSDSWEERC